MAYQHQSLSSGRWFALSLIEQLGNIGSEISRAKNAGNDSDRSWSAIVRAFELLDLTISDSRWQTRLKELLRTREVLGDAILGGQEYHTTLEDMDRYFYYFALAARAKH